MARYRFAQDRHTFAYFGPGEPIRQPGQIPIEVYTDEECTQEADLVDLEQQPCPGSIVYVGKDGLLQEFYGPDEVVVLWGTTPHSVDPIRLDALFYDRLVAQPGTPGPPGPAGPQGIPGPPGEPGPAAAFGTMRGEWSPEIFYAEADVVLHEGQTWYASGNPPLAEEPATSSTFWLPLALEGAEGPEGLPGPQGIPGIPGPQGTTGPPGPAGPTGSVGATGAQGEPGELAWTAAWSPTTDYDIYALVGHDGSTWLAISDPPVGEEPSLVSVHWDPFAVQGETGEPGTVGPPGPQGAQGIPGPTGPTGATGAPGARGIQGATGPQGAQGVRGPQGLTGPQGLAGMIRVDHGTNPDLARPDYPLVLWVGSVEPVHADRVHDLIVWLG